MIANIQFKGKQCLSLFMIIYSKINRNNRNSLIGVRINNRNSLIGVRVNSQNSLIGVRVKNQNSLIGCRCKIIGIFINSDRKVYRLIA